MQSSLRYRPGTLSGVIGQDKVKQKLTRLWKKKKFPNALLFHGPSGVGKTTIARIIALSLQCRHGEFGNPCKSCRKAYKEYPIFEINASESTGVPEIKQFISGSQYDTLGKHTRKIYILDEAHRISDPAQNLLLKYFEEHSSVLYIICTTQPEKIIDTLRQRCRPFRFADFSLEEVKKMVEVLLEKLHSKLSSEELVDELYENRITSGRLIANAVDNYVSGETPEDSVAVSIESEVQTKPLCRAVVKGIWADTAEILKKANRSEVRLLRAGVLGYLQEVMLNDPDISDRTTGVANAMLKLTELHAGDTQSQFSAFAATLYKLCKIFKQRGL